MPDLRIGCSGFTYQDWRGRFYPQGLPERKWFEHYCTVFSTVELNVTFYRLPQPAAFDTWYEKSPSRFLFSIKGSRFITHVKRLLNPVGPVKLFFQRALRLKEKLGVVLWQFAPSFTVNIERLENFLKLLRKYPVRTALEFRHESWITDDVFGLCREHKAGLCMADRPEIVKELPVTADFVYFRRHGESGSYATRYSQRELATDAARIRQYLRRGKDAYIYFNNDAYGYAAENARELMEMFRRKMKSR